MKKILILIGIVTFLLLTFFAQIFYNFYNFKEIKSLDMYYQVSDKVGFNADTEALFFGKGTPGSKSERNLQITNSYNYPINVLIKIDGDIKPLASVSKNDFVMQSGESINVTYHIITNQDTPKGNYSGNTTLVFTRPLFE